MAGTLARILVVDDDRKLRETLAEGLELEGWEIETAGTGRAALEHLGGRTFHVVVLDWMLPDQDGLEVLRQTRARGIGSRILMVTARGTVADRVTGFDQGADDYLVKPFAFEELVARCRALLRRPAAVAGVQLCCADLELDTRARVATRGGEIMALTPLEVDLLEYLLRQQEQVVTREMLHRDVWKGQRDENAASNAINIHVARLRQKIDREPWPKLLHTLHGVGYRCAAPGGSQT
jgi:DNA-binding response OmpR family regulator